MVEMPSINRGKCQGCGLCVSVCKTGALVLIRNKVTINKGIDCNWCTLCEAVCPNGAITCPYIIVLEDR